jgi:hypothetical protein
MSKIEVNQIASQIGGVLTIGASGDTVSLAAGASQSGFGRSGSVNWDTTKKTANFTAVSGNGYFLDTTTTTLTITLPTTPSAGDIVAIADYANTSATNNITVGRNGSNIDGEAIDAKIKINGQVYTLVYVDATEGWKTVGQTFNQINTAEFVAATGGTVTCCGDFKIHTFTGPGTFTVSNAGNSLGSNSVEYLVVAGGGGGVVRGGGGGGAGGFRQNYPSPTIAGLPVSVTTYPITVGGGGSGVSALCVPTPQGGDGNPSIFSTITSTGGGGGGSSNSPAPLSNGKPGGSGGGRGGSGCGSHPVGGLGNTPPVSPPQGNDGGGGAPGNSAGGGGAGAVGTPNPTPGSVNGTAGGAGLANSITGSPVFYAGGGGGGGNGPGGSPGPGGNGGGGPGGTVPGGAGTAGTVNTGGGAGGGGWAPGAGGGAGAAGGSGIVVIRYKFQ